MKTLQMLFDHNAAWAEAQIQADPQYFERLAKGQKPDYLWIGCADSRVPANQILGLPPGEVFVHRNIANVVVHTDFNCLSVMQFAVDLLKVRHIMVVGHLGCSGVHAAMNDARLGIADNWLRHIRDVYDLHATQLDRIDDDCTRHDRLCELNVIEQAANVCQSTVVEEAWQRGQELSVHGWVYGLNNGRLRDLNFTVTGRAQVADTYRAAVKAVFAN
ncbi:carbonate dehydratase [Sinimarinibacterium sp. CAU 1509]|uniref:carbonate dehydratase n=1 Tax=Sinimarinibacterium sp. CAU 1509 TaxID=2562283 RepID=UPI0010AC9829|nr:carbonate dehydratase [Sinimarinibacterium sp. CAU 1509]TJY59872.1 carbonate dehydratase [Sinimarinibacterium sp. CAU 1509]